MTIADQILAAVAGRETFRRAELFDRFDASENGIDIALAKLVEAGMLVRFAPGMYSPTDGTRVAEPSPAEAVALAPTPKPAAPAPAAEAESTTEPEPEPELELAAWHTGELTVRRGDQVVLLSPAEVETLMRFAGRMLRVEE